MQISTFFSQCGVVGGIGVLEGRDGRLKWGFRVVKAVGSGVWLLGCSRLGHFLAL